MAEEEKLTGYPSIDKPWLKYYNNKSSILSLDKCTLYKLLLSQNANYPNDIAIKYFGKNISYEMVFNEVRNCALALSAVGIKKGDCVNLLTAGIPEAVYLVLACSQIGAIANFINPLLEETEKIDRINDTKSQWLFVLDEMIPYIESVVDKLCSKNIVLIPISESFPAHMKILLSLKRKKRLVGSNHVSIMVWRNFIDNALHPVSLTENTQTDEPVLMVYSSGTTGVAKGILHTNDSINATIQDSLSSGIFLKRGMTFLQMIPIWFSTGIIQSILLPLYCGVTVIMEPRFDNSVFVKDMLKNKPTMTIAATSMWMAAIDDIDFDKVDLSKLMYPFTGGEKVTVAIEETMNSFLREHNCKVKLIKGYGMCELGGKVTDSIAVNKAGSVGIPMSHIIVGIFDPLTDKELRYGGHGEIRVNTPAQMKEYFNNKEATREFFYTDNNGVIWGRTGDIGYIDSDGLLFVLGRSTDSFINDDGEITYLFDIEEEIIKDEAVRECKVVYTPVNNQHELIANIVFKSDLKDHSDDYYRIISRLKDRLPAQMIPHCYKSLESMPINKNGKKDIERLNNDIKNIIYIE